MTSPRRLLVIADVGGDDTRHIGDEAMLEANLEGFRRLLPAVAFTVVSDAPRWTASRHGVDAVAPFGFPRDAGAGAEREALLHRLLADARNGQGANATIDAVARADGVVMSGGGNISSTWPALLYERVALLQLARLLGKPVVVLGQTIGPSLAPEERRQVAEALSGAGFVGCRELPSAALALGLGVPPERIWYQGDDALFLEESPGSVPPLGPPRGPAIAVTIDPQIRASGEAVFGSLVRQLRELSETTGAPLLLVPHAFGGESAGVPSDLTEALVLVERLGLPRTLVAAGLDASQAKQVAGQAALVISSRYHPIVFALAAGIPSLGIYGDEYCRIKLQGALAHAGLQRWTLTYDDVAEGKLLPSAMELWRARAEVRLAIQSFREGWREEQRQRWGAVLQALDPARPGSSPKRPTMFGRPMQDVAPALASALEALREAGERERASFAARAESLALGRESEGSRGPTIGRYASSLLRWTLGRLTLRRR
jgi:polysaccharide pyruvyl transferase WcaK-like protein